MVRIEVRSRKPGVASVWVEVTDVSENQCQEIYSVFDTLLSSEKQESTAVAKTFQFSVETCPLANPSDLWHHIIYRRLLEKGYNDQQWKRLSGFALERAFVSIYLPRLQPYHLRMRIVGSSEAAQLLITLGLESVVKPNKVDMFIEGMLGPLWTVFGAAHVKSSIAERIQDDVPASLAFMNKGLASIAMTMDAKSFPPPHGDGINHGELGARSFSITKDRTKRLYIEDYGQFDALFSFNLRTPPSLAQTPSGKKIYTLSLTEQQPDILVKFLVHQWENRVSTPG
jgi:hypothetical protein